MLKKEVLDNFKGNYESDKTNVIRRRMLNKVSLVDLISDDNTNFNLDFSIDLKSHGVTDQKYSGRCWIFAGLNILREKVIEKCKLTSFNLSGSYIAFYDKIERSNLLMERLINYKKEKKNIYDWDVDYLLENGISDGGYFTQFADLINKYGVVPQSNYSESFQSENTYEINQIISRLLRKFYLELEKDTNPLLLKDKYLGIIYNILTNVYGMPPEKFNFEYTDNDNKYHIDKDLTPKLFYDKYIAINLKDYIEIASYKDEKYDYNKLYQVKDSTRISGNLDLTSLNLNHKEMLNLTIKQLKHKEPVYFYCSTTSKRIDGIWCDIYEKFGDIFGTNLVMSENDILKSNGITGSHAMIITGINIIDNKPTKWKIENSWGDKGDKKGYWVATNEWIDRYIYKVIINKKYLTKAERELLKQDPIIVSKLESRF